MRERKLHALHSYNEAQAQHELREFRRLPAPAPASGAAGPVPRTGAPARRVHLHWLFFDDDPDSESQARALHERQLSVRHVNIKPSRLGKLRIAPAVWRYDAPGADLNVLVHLSQRWPLDEQLPA